MPGRHAHDQLTDASRRLGAAARTAMTVLAASAVLLVVLAGQGVLPAQAVVIGLAATATAATLVALTVAASRPAVRAVGAVALRPARRGTPAERVEAPTPFWCTVEVARRPSRPRGPGGR